MDVEKEQELEWLEAQKIEISVDLVAAAKQHLQFLTAVDRNRFLYEGPALQKAIYRYNACWLPLLAKLSESQISEEFLVIPLDCEWIWHCHRLNPVQYKKDCQEFYGKTLDNFNVVSSLRGTRTKKTEAIWNRLYPEEPYEFNFANASSAESSADLSKLEKCTKYDLISAVRRQSPFSYQVFRSHMNNDIFLEEAVARYKGFLHLIRRNMACSIRRFCVPTYDIDLIWHTHQLNPVSYCKDVCEVLGKILEHDDMDQDRTKGKKLDSGFSATTKQWEDTFGSRYWKAGAMYRGTAPSPLTSIPFSPKIIQKDIIPSKECQEIIHLPETNVMMVFVEIVAVRNLPDGHKGNLFVLFSKSQPDAFFNAERKLSILSRSGVKQVAYIQCEPTGELFFELVSHSPSKLRITVAPKTMGTASLSLPDFLVPVSKLQVEKWFDLKPSSDNGNSKPIGIRIAVSFTVPTLAPHVLRMVRSRPLSKTACFFFLPERVQNAKSWVDVSNETHSDVITLQMRNSKKNMERNNCASRKQVIGIMESSETHSFAELGETGWSLINAGWSLQLKKKFNKEDHLFELIGKRMIKIFLGRKLDYEPKNCEKQKSEKDFMTAVEFSAVDPYGKAIALFDLKSGVFQVKEEWFVFPGIISAFIVSDTLKKEGYEGFTVDDQNLETNGLTEDDVQGNRNTASNGETKLSMNAISMVNRGSSGGCGGGSGNMANAGGCGGGCSGECGTMVKTDGCDGGCSEFGGGCGTMVKDGRGCDVGCGNNLESGGNGSGCGGSCSGKCGGGCGTMVKNGGGCDVGCGNKLESGDCGGSCSGCGGGGCSGGCGGGYGNMLETGGGCGGGCSGNYGGGCSGGCGGGYGNKLESSSACGGGCSGKCGGGCGGGGCGGGSCSGGHGGGYGNNLSSGGGCGSSCGGGCGGGSATIYKNNVGNSCNEECSDETSISRDEAVVA